jgi:uncharacterized protein (TIGR02246 family)
MLTIEDRLAIQDLYARYCATLDTGDWAAWSCCFTEDAVFAGFQEVRGRDAIAAYGRMRCEERPQGPWTCSQHWNSNLVVEGEGVHAKALCYLLTMGTAKSDGSHQLKVQGTYQDELAKVDGQWLFRRRLTRFDPPSPDMIPQGG